MIFVKILKINKIKKKIVILLKKLKRNVQKNNIKKLENKKKMKKMKILKKYSK